MWSVVRLCRGKNNYHRKQSEKKKKSKKKNPTTKTKNSEWKKATSVQSSIPAGRVEGKSNALLIKLLDRKRKCYPMTKIKKL